MALANITAKTFSATKTEAPNSMAVIFNRALTLTAASADVFTKFEGEGEESRHPVCRKTDLQKNAGQTVHFTVLGSLNGYGKLGEQTLIGNEEKPRVGTTKVTVDFVRNGTASTKKLKAFMAAGMSYEEACAKLLGEWLGRKRQTSALWKLRTAAVSGWNIVPGGRKSTVDQLLSTSTFSTTLIGEAAGRAKKLGAKPLKLTKSQSGAMVQKLMFFGPDEVLRPVTTESAYVAALNQAQTRGYGNNEQWDGGFADWQGHGIFHWDTVDPDSEGPQGSMLDPRAALGTAITAGTTAIDITGGGHATPDTSALPFEFFPGFEWKIYEEQEDLEDTGVYYLVVYNVTGASAGKWGFYSYVGEDNDGNKITITERLGSAASDARVTTLGSVTWDAGVHTDAHPAGSPIYLANAKGVIYGYVACLGANALLRAYGGGNNGIPIEGTFDVEKQDYGMIKGTAITACFGTDVWLDTQGKPRNYVLCPVAYQPEGINMPTVTS